MRIIINLNSHINANSLKFQNSRVSVKIVLFIKLSRRQKDWSDPINLQ